MAEKIVKLPFEYFNPKQEQFLLSKTRHVGYGGARGGGKSYVTRAKAIMLACEFNGLKILLLRRTFPELRENHILPLQAILTKDIAKWKEEEKTFIFVNKSRLKLGYCDSEGDVNQYLGQEFDVIFFEEATTFTEYQKDFILTCNRSTRKDFKPRAYYTSNPGGVGHAWFKRLFIDHNYRGKEKPNDYTFIQATVQDNKILMETNPEYIDILENLPEELKKAYLDGDWDVLSGQYFKEWRKKTHCVEKFDIPKHWKRFVSIDWGYNDPCAVLWHACDTDRHIYTYKELYIRQVVASKVAKRIVQMSKGEKIDYFVASPDMWQKRGSSEMDGESIADTFIDNGVDVTPANHDRHNGWQRMHEYMGIAPDGKPYWMIFDSECPNLARCLPELQHDPNDVEDVATEPHEITNAPDSARYGMMSRPPISIEEVNTLSGYYTEEELKDLGYKNHEIKNITKKMGKSWQEVS